MVTSITAAAHAYQAPTRSPFIIGLLRDVIEHRPSNPQPPQRAFTNSRFDVLA